MAKSKSKSRPARWAEAVAAGQTALQEARDAEQALEDAKAALENAMTELEDLRSEYEDWQGNLPDSLQQSPVAEKLDAVVGLSLSWSADDDLEDASSMLDEADGADLPRGFGND